MVRRQKENMNCSAIGRGDATKVCPTCGGHDLIYEYEFGPGDLYRCFDCGEKCVHRDWCEGKFYRFELNPLRVPAGGVR
jgi:hypothetical protein